MLDLLEMLEAKTWQQAIEEVKRLHKVVEMAGRVVENAVSMDETAFNPAEYAINAEYFMGLYSAYSDYLTEKTVE